VVGAARIGVDAAVPVAAGAGRLALFGLRGDWRTWGRAAGLWPQVCAKRAAAAMTPPP
jgi:hypothetical protein